MQHPLLQVQEPTHIEPILALTEEVQLWSQEDPAVPVTMVLAQAAMMQASPNKAPGPSYT